MSDGLIEDVDGEMVSSCASTSASSRDGCVVATEPLAIALGGFVRERNRRAVGGGRFAGRGTRTEVPVVGAYEWLEQETRHHDPSGRGVTRKTIKRIVSGGSTVTELKVADLLVAAIGRPDLLYDGTLEVFANPRASRSARDACCGGSQSPTRTNAVTGNPPVT